MADVACMLGASAGVCAGVHPAVLVGLRVMLCKLLQQVSAAQRVHTFLIHFSIVILNFCMQISSL